MEFKNLVKGQLTQSLVKVLLERAGYRVTRLGVEELFSEIKYLSMEQYLSLDLPLNLRDLPDLLVAEPDMQKVFLVEVKFRKEFNELSMDSLYSSLKKQREHWPNSYAVIMIAKPFVDGGRFHQDCIRVLWPGMTESLNRNGELNKQRFKRAEESGLPWNNPYEEVWNFLPTVTTSFRLVEGMAGGFANADLITNTIKDLAKL